MDKSASGARLEPRDLEQREALASTLVAGAGEKGKTGLHISRSGVTKKRGHSERDRPTSDNFLLYQGTQHQGGRRTWR